MLIRIVFRTPCCLASNQCRFSSIHRCCNRCIHCFSSVVWRIHRTIRIGCHFPRGDFQTHRVNRQGAVHFFYIKCNICTCWLFFYVRSSHFLCTSIQHTIGNIACLIEITSNFDQLIAPYVFCLINFSNINRCTQAI